MATKDKIVNLEDLKVLSDHVEGEVTDLKSDLSDFTGFQRIWMSNGYIPANKNVGDTIDLSDVRENDSITHAVVQCESGDIFTINSVGTNTSRSYVFVDASNNVVEIATATASANGFTGARLVAPATATRLLIQTKNNLKSYKGQPSTLEDVFDSIDDTNQNIEEHFTAKKVMPTNPHILDYNKVNLFNYNGTVNEDKTYVIDGYYARKFSLGTSYNRRTFDLTDFSIGTRNFAEVLITVADPSLVKYCRLMITFGETELTYSFGYINQLPYKNQSFRLRTSFYDTYSGDYSALSSADKANITKVEFIMNTDSGTTDYYFHAINFLNMKPYFNICCDGNWESVYTLAFPYMEKKGVKGSAYIEVQQVDNPTEDGHMSYEQIKDLELHGWDIASHTYYHRHMDGLDGNDQPYYNDAEENEAYIAEDLAKARKWLIDHEFWRGVNFVAPPAGRWKRQWFDMYGEYCKFIRGGDTTSGYVFPSEASPINKVQHISYKSIGSVSYPPSVLKPIIDDVIAKGKSMNLNLHIIKESGATGTVQYNIDDFKEIVDYLCEKRDAGLIHFGRISDLYFNGYGNITFNRMNDTASVSIGKEVTDLTT